jgi:hypothetical protein
MEGTRDTGHGAPGGHRTRGHRESRREIGFTDCALGPLRDYGPASGAQVLCSDIHFAGGSGLGVLTAF